jgi:hypothetical protein
MRILAVMAGVCLVLTGCGKRQVSFVQWPGAGVETNADTKSGGKVVITPEKGLVGTVASANTTARFVVLNFPVGRLPSLEQRLQVYRGGLKVGELKVSGPQLDDAIVADITAGDAKAGDEVREQ